MRNRLLTAFVRKYGYLYLQKILNPLIEIMLANSPDHSYEIDPNKFRSGEDRDENLQQIQLITKAFLDVIIGSVSVMPP